MKVLISAYACEPGRGSEPGVGWNVVRGLSERHELWVMTRADNERAISTCGEAWVRRVRWIYLDPPRRWTFWKRGARGLRVFYLWWQVLAMRRARELQAAERFHVVQHLTFGNYLPPLAWGDLGPPFVYGPLGGGDFAPAGLLDGLGGRAWLAEWLRELRAEMARRLPFVRRAYRGAALCLGGTPGTVELLRELGAPRVRLLPQSGMGDDEIGRFSRFAAGRRPRAGGPLRLVSACRLVGWKAVDLSLEAVAELRRRGVEAELEILHDGPERPRLERMAARLGLGERVRFRGVLPSLEAVYEAISAADALLHPALHEAFGQVCLESLALGVPVLCLDHAGPGMIVRADCGFPIRPGDRRETVMRMAEALEWLAGMDESARAALSARARVRAGDFAWRVVVEGVERAYAEVSAG